MKLKLLLLLLLLSLLLSACGYVIVEEPERQMIGSINTQTACAEVKAALLGGM